MSELTPFALENLFWRAARSTYVEAYKLALEDLKAENEEAYENFIDIGPQKFCKAFISTSVKCDMIDNSVSETFNGYIVNARGKHVIHMLEDIRLALMKRRYIKLTTISSSTNRICPTIRTAIEKLKYESRLCITYPNVGGIFEVHLYQHAFVVNLGSKTCACRVWDLT